MTAKMLIAAQDLSRNPKGDIIAVLSDGGDFGGKEILPKFIRLIVSDATTAEATAYLTQWGKVFSYSIINENAQGYRIRIEVDPAVISVSGNGAEVNQELKDYVLSGMEQALNVTLHAQDGISITVDVEKPVDLQRAKLDLNDKFAEVISTTRYYFDDATVDAAIAAGGEFTRTKAQVVALLRDKLDD